MRNLSSQNTRQLTDIVADLRAAFSNKNLTQSEAAKACSLNQSQVSRILDGKCTKISKGVYKLCIYASININVDSPYDPSNDELLMRTLRLAVGRSASRARQIQRVLSALTEG